PTWKSSWTRFPSTRPGGSPSVCSRAGTTTGVCTGTGPRRAAGARRGGPPAPLPELGRMAVPVIIDGYNLLYARGEAPAPASRGRLVTDLVAWARARTRRGGPADDPGAG